MVSQGANLGMFGSEISGQLSEGRGARGEGRGARETHR